MPIRHTNWLQRQALQFSSAQLHYGCRELERAIGQGYASCQNKNLFERFFDK